MSICNFENYQDKKYTALLTRKISDFIVENIESVMDTGKEFVLMSSFMLRLVVTNFGVNF